MTEEYDWDVIYSYSRGEAIEDGVLIDVSAVRPDLVKEAGIKIPVAVSEAAWKQYVEVLAGVDGQDVDGRLWDILQMFVHVARGARDSDTVYFSVHVRNDNREGMPPLVKLKAIIGPGDEGEAVLTIMRPEED